MTYGDRGHYLTTDRLVCSNPVKYLNTVIYRLSAIYL